jgi:hypothetical protein
LTPAQPPYTADTDGSSTTTTALHATASSSSATFRPDHLLLDTGANLAMFNHAVWFDSALGSTLSTSTVEPVTGIGSASLPEARGIATVAVLDDSGTTQSLSFDAHLDRSAPVNLVGLAGLQASGLTSAEWNGNEFRWHFSRGQVADNTDQDFTITTRPTAEAHGLHALDIMQALFTEQALPAASAPTVPAPVAFVATTPVTLREAH